jgi:kumamolisin
MVWSVARSRTVIGSTVAVAVMGAAMLSGSAVALAARAHSSPGSMTTVPQGINAAALPGAQVFGTTPADTPESVSFILRERNLPQLETSVEHGVRQDLSVSQFAATYGQTPGAVHELTAYLAGFGIKTTVYADSVDVSATGTAGEFDNALSVQQFQYRVPRVPGSGGMRAIPAQTVHGTKSSPELPGGIAQDVLAILGLSNYSPYTSQALHVSSKLVHPQAGSSNFCVGLTGLANDCHTASDFANDYKLSPLYQKGADGQGQTLAIVTLAALDPGAPQYYWQNILHQNQTTSRRTLTVDNIDGGPGTPSDASGSGETDLDVEQSGGIAPGANVIVYQAPNTDPGFADAFFTAASDNTASSVSASWGESETYVKTLVAAGAETPAYQAAFDEAFLEFAAQGQSGFLSSGDDAAYDAQGDAATTNLAVDTNADSPYITASGGTTVPWSGTLSGTGGTVNVTVDQQRAWGWDYLWQAMATSTGVSLTTAAEANVVGSGGGFSTFEPEPSYQDGVSGTNSFSAVPYLTPTDYTAMDGLTLPEAWSFDPTPTVSHGFGQGRTEPDLSTNADPFSGYLIYEPSWATASPAQPVLQGGWGGTSFVAPELNGSTAVIDSYRGGRVGLWNPTLYAAATRPNSPLTPLDQTGTGNDNIYYSGTRGTVYNEGSGLGYPNLSELAADFTPQH